MRWILGFGLVLALAGCQAGQVQGGLEAGAEVLQAACSDALAAGNLAQATTSGQTQAKAQAIVGYVQAACLTSNAVAKLALDSNSLQWLGKNQGLLEGLKDG